MACLWLAVPAHLGLVYMIQYLSRQATPLYAFSTIYAEQCESVMRATRIMHQYVVTVTVAVKCRGYAEKYYSPWSNAIEVYEVCILLAD